jgi:hypothetical protein
MANIFKTTLKKDIIADIANNGKREVRFPVTKFWATRFSDKYNLNDKTFIFKTFDSLEFSSPSNKDSIGETYVFDFVKTYIDGDEFVIEFKDQEEVDNQSCEDVEQSIETGDIVNTTIVEEDVQDDVSVFDDDEKSTIEDDGDSDVCFVYENNEEDYETMSDSIDVVYDIVTQWLDDEHILDNYFSDENVFATKAKQIIVLPKGKVLGFKKTLPVNNDAEVRIEFDMYEKIYLDSIISFNDFVDNVLNTLTEIRKNNFVFVWNRYTGIFIDDKGIYFGIKYSTRKSIGFNRKYNVQ